MKAVKAILLGVVVTGMAACTAQKKTDEGTPTTGAVTMPGGKTVYFDFDKSEIKGEYQSVVTDNAKYLAGTPNTRARVEGHCDERGSREYNVGLGERRAQAVRRLMLFQGVADNQIETVSYGEERPAVKGHNEDAWSKNRRAEIVYLK